MVGRNIIKLALSLRQSNGPFVAMTDVAEERYGIALRTVAADSGIGLQRSIVRANE
jgi:hypothetical protein